MYGTLKIIDVNEEENLTCRAQEGQASQPATEMSGAESNY